MLPNKELQRGGAGMQSQLMAHSTMPYFNGLTVHSLLKAQFAGACYKFVPSFYRALGTTIASRSIVLESVNFSDDKGSTEKVLLFNLQGD